MGSPVHDQCFVELGKRPDAIPPILGAMNSLGYDAAALGNHEFNYGLGPLYEAQKRAKFPFLCANYDFSDTILKGETKSYEIFQKDDLRIGVFGIGIDLNGLVSENNYLNTKFLNPVFCAERIAKELKQKGCDLVICLSHLGYEYADKTKISKLPCLKIMKNKLINQI